MMLDEPRLTAVSNGMAIDHLDAQLFAMIKATVELEEEISAYINEILSEFALNIMADATDAGLQVLFQFQEYVDRQLTERLGNHSVPFVLTVFRSLTALTSSDELGSRDEFARVMRIMELAICRYCRYDVSDVSIEDEYLWSVLVTRDDIKAIWESVRLIQLLGTCQVDLRRIAYGGHLVRDGTAWRVDLPAPTQYLSEIHDRRVGQYGNLFRHAGIPGPEALPRGRGACWIFLGGKNEDHDLWSGRFKDHRNSPIATGRGFIFEDDSYVPVFMLGEFSLDGYAHVLDTFGAGMQTHGFTPGVAKALLKSLASYGDELYNTLRPGHRLRAFGFTIASKKAIQSRIARSLEASGRTIPGPVIEAAIRYVARSRKDRHRISLNEPTGTRHIVDLGRDRLLIDYMTSFSAVRRIFDIVGAAEGAAANVRSGQFEQYVADRLIAAMPSAMKLWTSTRLTFNDGRILDADVGVIIGDLLVLCECKARVQKTKIDGITAANVSRLTEEHRKNLNQVDRLAHTLATKRVRGPEPLPGRLRGVLPCVITPSVEWVGTNDPVAWLSRSVPRVCTVEELIDALLGDRETLTPHIIRIGA
jgi:hypothetical protein